MSEEVERADEVLRKLDIIKEKEDKLVEKYTRMEKKTAILLQYLAEYKEKWEEKWGPMVEVE